MKKENKEVEANGHSASVVDSTAKDEAWYEFEGCENCIDELEEDGIEYEFNASWIDGGWVCDYCGRPC